MYVPRLAVKDSVLFEAFVPSLLMDGDEGGKGVAGGSYQENVIRPMNGSQEPGLNFMRQKALLLGL